MLIQSTRLGAPVFAIRCDECQYEMMDFHTEHDAEEYRELVHWLRTNGRHYCPTCHQRIMRKVAEQ